MKFTEYTIELKKVLTNGVNQIWKYFSERFLMKMLRRFSELWKWAVANKRTLLTHLFKIRTLVIIAAPIIVILTFILSRPIVEIEECKWYAIQTLSKDIGIKFDFELQNKGLRPAKVLLRKADVVVRVSIAMNNFPNYGDDINKISETFDAEKEKRLLSYVEYRRKVLIDILHFFEKQYSRGMTPQYISNYFKTKWKNSGNDLEVYGDINNFFPRPKTIGAGKAIPDSTGRSVGMDIEKDLADISQDAIILFLEYDYNDCIFTAKTYCIAYFDRILSGRHRFLGRYQMTIYRIGH